MFESITYSDGSANGYVFTAVGDSARFEYTPVRPEHSSTGMYSGGEPREGMLDGPQTTVLHGHVSALEANTALHVTDRGKGTGRFQVRDERGDRSFIIARGPELLAFDAFVRALS
jgi:hypothetical protein